MITKRKVTSALVLALTVLLISAVAASATIYVWVQPTIYTSGVGSSVTVNDDGTLNLTAGPGGYAGVYWESGLTIGEFLDITGMNLGQFLLSPAWIEVMSQTNGGPTPWEQNGMELDSWIGLWYGPLATSNINDPTPVWLHNWLSDAWMIDPANAPSTWAEFMDMQVNLMAEVQGGLVGSIHTHWIEYCIGPRPPAEDDDGGDVVPVPDSAGNSNGGNEDVCFKFYLSPSGDARIRFDPVVVFNYPTNFAYTRAWAGSEATTPYGHAWELDEVGEAMLYAPWNVGSDPEYGRFVKTSWANNSRYAEIAIIEFHDVSSGVLGTCLTKRIPFAVSAIDYPTRCYSGQSLETLIVTGVVQATYAQAEMLNDNRPVGRVVDGNGAVTWYFGQ